MSLFGIGAIPVFNAVAGMIGAHQQNKANSAANQQMIDWERERAQNAHQWEVQDLRKAGLNPILSAGGSGASTSGVSIIPSSSSPMAKGITDALTGMTMQEQLDGLKKDNKLKQQNYDNLDALMNYGELVRDEKGKPILTNGIPTFQFKNLIAENYALNVASNALQNSLMKEELIARRYQNFKDRFEFDALNSPYGKYLWSVDKGLDLASRAASVVYGVGGGLRPAPKTFHYQWSPHVEKGTKRYVEIHNGKEF